MCRSGKIEHLTWEQAQRAARKIKSRAKGSYRAQGRAPAPYRCRFCRRFHVGNTSRREAEQYHHRDRLPVPTLRLIHLMTPEEVREHLDRLTPESREELLQAFVQFCAETGPPHIKYVAQEVITIFTKEKSMQTTSPTTLQTEANFPFAVPSEPTTYPLTEQEEARILNTFTYHPPKGDQARRYEEIRAQAKKLAVTLLQCCPRSRELSHALTLLEDAVMNANAAIARNE